MSKKVARRALDPDHWIRTGEHREILVPMKRLSFDIPAELHTAFKADCALRGVKMVDDLRQVIEARVAELKG
jgi:hypothetical protein